MAKTPLEIASLARMRRECESTADWITQFVRHHVAAGRTCLLPLMRRQLRRPTKPHATRLRSHDPLATAGADQPDVKIRPPGVQD